MKDQADTRTADLFPVKRGPGRPVTGKAKSNAERQKRYRQNKAAGLVASQSLPSVSEVLATDWNFELEQLRAQLRDVEQDRDRWRGMYDIAVGLESNPELERLRARIEGQVHDIDRLVDERDEALIRVSQLESQLSLSQSDVRFYQDKEQGLSQKVESLHQELGCQDARIEELQGQLVQARAEKKKRNVTA
jgi:chromosome segregation ATPase